MKPRKRDLINKSKNCFFEMANKIGGKIRQFFTGEK